MNNFFEEPVINLTEIFEDAETLGDVPGMGGGFGSSRLPND